MSVKFRFALALWFVLVASSRAEERATVTALPPIETADYDNQSRFRVNGKFFFPILLYDAPTDDANLTTLREFGFNTLTCKPDVSAALPAKGFYGAVHNAEKVTDTSGIFLVLGTDSPALNFKTNLFERLAAANAKSVAEIPGRPLMNAIGYWLNEPQGVVAGELPPREKYDDVIVAIDVAGPYLYPVPYQPVASVGEAVARARLATQGKKPIVPILQIFAWEPTSRYPTPAELRCMAYLALVEGASGIGYYSYGHVTGRPKEFISAVQPELWGSVKQLNREIAEIGPLLLATGSAPSLSLAEGNSAVKFQAAGANDGFPAVIVNSSPTEQAAQLVLKSGGSAQLVLDDGRKLAVNDGSGLLTLKPLEVVVVRRAE